jgi:nanoRNase/pAp phosphatase (c-di-AMP/oligoRNAs hydrolase)
MDTGSFTFDGNSTRTLRNAARLVEMGADKNAITYHMFRSRSFNTMKHVQSILERLNVHEETILRSYTTSKEKEELSLNKNDQEYAQYIIQQIA